MKRLVIFIIIILLIVGALLIVLQNNLNVKNECDRQTFLNKYLGWLGDLGKNIGKAAAYAVKLEWLPKK